MRFLLVRSLLIFVELTVRGVGHAIGAPGDHRVAGFSCRWSERCYCGARVPAPWLCSVEALRTRSTRTRQRSPQPGC